MREFRVKKGRWERYWQIWFEADPGQEPEIIGTAVGRIDDKGARYSEIKSTTRPGPKGKAGTKAYMTAAENAVWEMDKLIRNALASGYYEVGLDGRPMLGGPTIEVIDHFVPLPKTLRFCKPRKNESDEKIRQLQLEDDLIFTMKIAGEMVVAHMDAAREMHLYNQEMEPITVFPGLCNVLTDMKIPACSILLFSAFKEDDRDIFYLFRVPVWKGLDIEKTNTCGEQVYLIENTFTDRFLDTGFLFALQNFEGTVPEALAIVEAENYEGLVCYQKSAVMGESSYNFRGQPDRPSCFFSLYVT